MHPPVARFAILLGAAVVLLLAAPRSNADPREVETSRKHARVLPLPKEEGVFHFVIYGDRTGSPESSIDILAQAVGETNLLAPDLVLTVGDLVNGYNARGKWMAQMREFRKVMDRLQMPWFPVPGNHDVYWGGPTPAPSGHHEADYESYFGPLWYWFGHKNAAFVALYSDEGDRARNRKGWGDASVNRFSDEQLAWLEGSLEKMEKYDHVFVFLHHPRWTPSSYPGNNWDAVHGLLKGAGNVRAVFAGHIHRQRYDGARDGIEYFTLATTGGAIPFDVPGTGYLHHMNLVTVREERISIATLPLGSVMDPREMTKERWADVDRLRRLAPSFPGKGLKLDPTGEADGRLAFQVKNPCKRPISITIEPDCADRSWWFTPGHLHLDLAPGATKRLELAYGRTGDGIEDLDFPRLSLQADYLAESMRIALPARSVLAPWSLSSLPDDALHASTNLSLVLSKGACLEIPAASIRVPKGPFTIEGWAKATTYKGRRAFLAKTENAEYGIFVSDGRPSFSVYLGSRYATASVQRPMLKVGRWHHLAGVYDGQEVHLYVDGRRVASGAGQGARRASRNPLYVGADPDAHGKPVSTFEGRIDEVRVSKGARYDRDVFEPSRRHTPDADTLLLLHLDRALGPIAVDCSSGRCHALRVGTVRYAR